MAVSGDERNAEPVERGALAAWLDAADVTPLAADGFSGAPLWLVRPRGGGPSCVLKAFAAGTPRERAAWVHALVDHVRRQGVEEVPALLPLRAGGTLVTDSQGTHWEVQQFVVGTATDAPSTGQAVAALDALARFHVAAGTLPDSPPTRGPSAGVARRVAQAAALVARPWRARHIVAAARAPHEARLLALRAEAVAVVEERVGLAGIAAVAAAEVGPVERQAVLRDVWSAHVLFDANEPTRVAGIVDCHAAAVDTPATDLARLLGSWSPPAGREGLSLLERWPEALAAYEAVRPLDDRERRLVPFLHAAGVVCGLDNWFRWTLEEGRGFAHPRAVLDRVERLVGELSEAVQWLAAPGVCRV